MLMLTFISAWLLEQIRVVIILVLMYTLISGTSELWFIMTLLHSKKCWMFKYGQTQMLG